MKSMKTNDQESHKKNPKDAGNNQWVTTHQKGTKDERKRKDGPGGD